MNGNEARRCGLDAVTPQVNDDPSIFAVMTALAISLILVFLTRLPVARLYPFETDEFGFLEQVRGHWFPMHHTLFLTAGRLVGILTGDAYRGLVVLDMITSALALVGLWWYLRALVEPPVAAAGALVLTVAPVFWGYGAVAGNYTAILAVGTFLLGIACRTWSRPKAWHPIAAAVVLALGTGYRQDIGTLWLPVFLIILWKHRWRPAILAVLIFTVINLAWLLAMLREAGGWARYRDQTAEFAYHAGYLNSVWNLGFADAPARYAVKLGMALLWTLGPCLVFVPRGIRRLRARKDGAFYTFILCLSIVPSLASHLLVHFGVPGYAFHYVPALLALCVLGIGEIDCDRSIAAGTSMFSSSFCTAQLRLGATAAILAAIFLFYPTDYDQPGWRGSFDLSFARLTRAGLRTPMPSHQPTHWRTANSGFAAETASASGDR